MIRSDGWAFAFNNNDETELLQIISSLSHKYFAGKVFLPHITCFESTICSEKDHNDLIQAIKKIKPFEIKLTKISYEKMLFKTLFIEVESNRKMTKIVQMFKDIFQQKFDFHPHISLIYKEDLDFAEREKLAQTLEFPKTLTVNAILRYLNGALAANFSEWKTERIEF